MSCAWPTVEDALERGFCVITGLKNRPNWLNRKAKVRKHPWGQLGISGVTTIGTPEHRHTHDAGRPVGKEIERTIHANTAFVLSIQIESREFKSGQEAWQLLELAKLRLSGERFGAIIRAVGVGFMRTGPVVRLDYKLNGRWVSRAALDVDMHAGSEIYDCPTTFIESVRATSDFRNIDGAALPSEYQFADEVIP